MQPSQPQNLERNQYLEQAKTHLETIEQGLLNLSEVVQQTKTLKRLHDAAKFLHQGAVTHELETIQHIAQFFEECFSLMGTAQVVSDQHLEDLLWGIFDTFQGLIDMHAMSQEPTEYTQGVEREVYKGIQQNLKEAKTYLHSCMVEDNAAESEVSPESETFHKQVEEQLNAMEELLEQNNPSYHRHDLQKHCDILEQIGAQAEIPNWVNLIKTAKNAIAGTENSVQNATESAIADIVEAQRLIKLDQAHQIQPSQQLKNMSLQLSSPWDTYSEQEVDIDNAEPSVGENLQEQQSQTHQEDDDLNFADLELDDDSSNQDNSDWWNNLDEILGDNQEQAADDSDWLGSLDEDVWELTLEQGSPQIDHSEEHVELGENSAHISDENLSSQQNQQETIGDFDLQDNPQIDHSQEHVELAEELSDQDLETVSDLPLEQDDDEISLSEFLAESANHENDADNDISDLLKELEQDDSEGNQQESGGETDWDELFGEQQTNDEDESDLDQLLSELDQSLSQQEESQQASLSDEDSLEDLEQLFANEQEQTFIQELEEAEEEVNEASEKNTFPEESSPPTPVASIEYYDPFSDLETIIEAAAASETIETVDFAALEALIDENPSPESATEAESSPKAETPASSSSSQTQSSSQPQSTPAPAANRSGASLFEQTVKVPVRLMDQLNNLIGELVVNRNRLEQDQERLRRFLDNLLEQVQNLNDLGGRMQDLYERSLLENSLLASKSYQNERALSTGGSGSAKGATYHQSSNGSSSEKDNGSSSQDNGNQYDPLEMDRFSGFHLLSQEMIELIVRVRESTSDIEFLVDEVEQEARTFRQVTTQLQEGFTSARMVTFSQVADRLPRAVREICKKQNKKAKLQVEGKDTLIDKMILEQLYDPMTHLVNNAITHGIEEPETRKASGKPETGTIKVEAHHQGNQTIISLTDDGAGLDANRIRAKAIDKGLISEAEANSLPDLDIFDFIFHPGFSTKEKADDFAGRGVGMDVVRSSLSKLRGSINIDSTLGQGTKFTIGLPLTLSISTALCCKLNQSNIAFPIDGVEDQLEISKDEITVNQNGERFIRWEKSANLLPIKHLSELFSYNRTLTRSNIYTAKTDREQIPVVVLRSTGNLIALEVDQVIGQQEIVIKQISGPVPKPIGIGGATVTSDGSVMAIADVLELIDLFHGRIRKDVMDSMVVQQEEAAEQEYGETEPMVLIVDDSITVRELLSSTFSNAGYRVEQARDGQEAWDKLQAGLACDMMFCDIEMPRMNGLDLLSQIKQQQQFADLPVGMLTSRGAERHREMAAQYGASGYFTKPYLEEVLLDAAKRMLKGENLIEQTSGV